MAKSKEGREFVAAAGRQSEVMQALAKRVYEYGGFDEDILRIVSDSDLSATLAKLIVGARPPEFKDRFYDIFVPTEPEPLTKGTLLTRAPRPFEGEKGWQYREHAASRLGYPGRRRICLRTYSRTMVTQVIIDTAIKEGKLLGTHHEIAALMKAEADGSLSKRVWGKENGIYGFGSFIVQNHWIGCAHVNACGLRGELQFRVVGEHFPEGEMDGGDSFIFVVPDAPVGG